MDLRPHLERFARRLSEVEAALSDPKVFDHKQRAQELSREYARLKELTATGDSYGKTVAQLAENRALLEKEPADSELAQLAREDIARLEAEEVDVEIKQEDLDISVCRASGPGGQGVNTTDSAVQIIHKPSGLIVRCADQRSQQKNKARALTVLRSRLLERKVEEENAKYAAQRKSQVGTGERNEKVRTYNFPQNRVTDHRIDLTLYNLAAFVEGDIDPILEPLMAHDLEEKLAAIQA